MKNANAVRQRRLLLLVAAACIACGTARSEESGAIRFLATWGTQGAGPGEFHFPIDIAITPADEIWITDHYNDRLQKFDTNGNLLGGFSAPPNPGGIAIGLDGNLYVSHFPATRVGMEKPGAGHFIAVYRPDGGCVRQWGRAGTADGEFDCPGGLAIDREGRVYVADQTNHRIQVFDSAGNFLRKWGGYGNETGQFGGMSSQNSRTGGPQFVALDPEGNLWTTEGANGRVQQFSPEGAFLLAWGANEDRPGGFGGPFRGFEGVVPTLQGPIALTFDAHGRLWISAVSGRVQCFTRQGTYLFGLTANQGTAPGQFFAPHGLAFDSGGNLYVVDAYNHRIQKFAVPAP